MCKIRLQEIEALITKAKAEERQAMLDIPEMQDEEAHLYGSTEQLALTTDDGDIFENDIAIGRNAFRAEIRAAIKKRGGSDE